MAKRLNTNTKADKRTLLPLANTPYKLAVPADMLRPDKVFLIGAVRFKLNGTASVYALDSIPASWFVDLSEGVQDLSEAE